MAKLTQSVWLDNVWRAGCTSISLSGGIEAFSGLYQIGSVFVYSDAPSHSDSCMGQLGLDQHQVKVPACLIGSNFASSNCNTSNPVLERKQ